MGPAVTGTEVVETSMAVWKRALSALLLAVVLSGPLALAGSFALAQDQGNVPGGALGNSSDPDFWRAIRRGDAGSVLKRSGWMVLGSLWVNTLHFRKKCDTCKPS